MTFPTFPTKLSKAKILVTILAIILITSIAIFAYSRFGLNKNPNTSNTAEIITTDAFILGGNLGGSAAAIQMVKDGVKFVMSEETTKLGGQATVQGVSTFDQNNKYFQKSGIYNDILENMKQGNVSKNGPYSGNATTGPGDLPANINSYLKSRLENYTGGRLLFGTILESVNKTGGRIDSVTLHDKIEISKKYTIKAKYFLDSSDYANITRAAGGDYNFGLDTQENIKETAALTSKEKDILVNGIQNGKDKIGGLGNLIQPVTTPFALLDKGYVGDKINFNSLAKSSKIKCNIDVNRDCLQITESLENNLELNHFGQYYFSFVFEGKVVNTDLQISINGEIKNLEPIVQKINEEDYTNFKIAYTKNTSNLNFSIQAKKSPLVLSDIFSTYLNFDKLSNMESLGDISSKAAAILPINKAKYEEAKKAYIFNLNDYKDKLSAGKNYYILSAFTNKNSPTVSRNISAFVNAESKNLFSVNFNPLQDFEEDYLPTYKINFDESKNFQVVFISNEVSKDKTVADSLILIEESKVNNFQMLLDKQEVTFRSSTYADLSYLGFSKGLEAVKYTYNNQSDGFTNKLYDQEDTPRIGFLQRTSISNKDVIGLNDKQKRSVLLIKTLNLEHYFEQIFNTFSNNKKNIEQILPAGNYDAYLKVGPESDVNFNKDDQLDLKVNVNSQDSIKRNFIALPEKFEKVLSFTLQNPGKIDVQLNPRCKVDCLKNISVLITASIPSNYDAGFLNRKINNNSNSLKLLYSSALPDQDFFFKFRKIVDPSNIAASKMLDEGTKNITSARSLGISQINTGFNDFSMVGTDVNKYINDLNYQENINQKAKQYSERYYYWLKYDAPKTYLGCLDGEIACSSLRLNISPIAMDTKDGFSDIPYVRDPVRPIGKSTITYNDIALKQNLCKSADLNECVELNIKSKDEKLSVSKDFIFNFPSKSLFAYFYAADIHNILSGEKLKLFNDYLKSSNLRTPGNLPKFLSGIYDTSVRPYSVDYDNLHSDKFNNLLFCGKSISVSQIANGSTRLHPAEASSGQACAIIVKFLIQNGDQNLTYLDNKPIYNLFRKNLIENGMYPLPLEDAEFAPLYKDSKFDILNSYFFSVQDKVLQPELITGDTYQHALYKLSPAKEANSQQIISIFNKLLIKLDDAKTTKTTFNFNDLKQIIINSSDYEKVDTALKEYHKNLNKVDKLDADYTITKGDLAYIYYKLGK